ncbi:AB-hydrolase lipase domain [Dillenia turbinata]|uniref:Lipase n=1 Tax=Dillenia turbinata TaxID=194707 RepID=A0AAN8WHE5_9MAGN
MEKFVIAALSTAAISLILFLLFFTSAVTAAVNIPDESNLRRRSADKGLCAHLIEPSGYPCTEHTVETDDGYVLGLQRVSSRNVGLRTELGPPVLLQHGLFMAGDAWFLDTSEQSLGFILADHGFDVWVGNVRGTRWSYGHKSLSEKDKEFWDWSWQELALYDLTAMIDHVYSTSRSKVLIVGHSQGTIMSLAALAQPKIADMVEAAAFLCPISYLAHVSAPLVLRMVQMHLDQMIMAMGIHQLNFRSERGIHILDSVCDGHLECNNLLTSITGKNCCFNNSRVNFYLEYEPHPSSSKNLNHLFQMIRKGTFAMYDYGTLKNLRQYGQFKPPAFDLGQIPKSLPIWMAYGGNDALADFTDMQQTLKELQSEPELLYRENYGHLDFILSVNGKEAIYDYIMSK